MSPVRDMELNSADFKKLLLEEHIVLVNPG